MTTQVTVAKETACRVRDAKRCVSQVTAAMETTGWVTSFVVVFFYSDQEQTLETSTLISQEKNPN